MALHTRPTLCLQSSLPVLALLSATAAAKVGDEPTDGSTIELQGTTYGRVERQLNEFTMSSQSSVAVDVDPTGSTVAVWHSRRQENGSYGIYARRLTPDGQPASDEVHVNATTRNMQMHPAVALDAEGAAWFAWMSFGQDGDEGTIVARRFDRELTTATAEVVVNEATAGDQSQVSIACLPDGGALVAWTSPDSDLNARQIHARRLAPDGTPAGSVFRVDQGKDAHNGVPVVETDSDGAAVVVWARTELTGIPRGIYTRRIAADGTFAGDEQRVDEAGKLHAIEPSLAVAANGDFVVAWMQTEGERYGVRMRRYTVEDDGLAAGAVHEVPDDFEGYASGMAVAVDGDDRVAVAWSRYSTTGEEVDLVARLFDGSGKPVSETFPVTLQTDGVQALTVARGTSRLVLADDHLTVAWHGSSGGEDGSAANVTMLLSDARATNAVAKASDEHVRFAPLEEGAKPHDPPTFDPNAVERRRGGTEGPIPGPLNDFDFLAIMNTGWVPPDPHIAVGPNHVVVMTNGAIAYFDKTGQFLFQDEIEDSFGFWGSVGATNFVFDPEVIFDPHSQRFIAMAAERAPGNAPFFVLAVSDDDNPMGTWFKYRFNVQSAVNDTDIDSPNIGVDEDVIYLTADFFGPDKFLVYMIEKAPLLSGGAINATSTVITPNQSLGTPITYDTDAPAQYMIWSQEGNGHTNLTVFAITDPLTNPQVQSTTVAVPLYNHPENPPNMGTSSNILTFEQRFWSCVYRNGSLWATHHINVPVKQRWYEIAMNGWPSGGTPALVQSGTVQLGAGVRSFFGSIAVDEEGDMALTYSRSATDEFLSIERTGRGASDPLGTTRTPVSIIGSTSAETSQRWGDYSGIVNDPTEADTFWAHHEYRTSSWRTRVARFRFCDGGVETYCTTSPNSVGSGAQIGSSGSTSVAANDFALTVLGCPLQQNGLFYYGPEQTQMPFGNGVACVSGMLSRLDVVTTDVFGFATTPLDITDPPTAAGQITAFSTWNFQFWYRDPNAGGAFFNFSDALSAEFCP